MRTTMSFNVYTEVPEWARFMDLDEFRAFLDAVASDLRSRGLLFQDNNGLLEVAWPDGRLARCGLANVALKCAAAGRDGYAREVAVHFDRILGKPPPLPPFPKSFEEVRPVVRVRVYSDEQLREISGKIVARPLADGLKSVAVYDLPHVIAMVSRQHLDVWKVSQDEVFKVGLENVRRERERMERDTFQLASAEIFSLLSEGGFAASQVHNLESYLSPSPFGAIVALPNRHMLICYPIVLETVLDALRALVPFVDGVYNDPPGGDERSKLTTDLYWWNRGALVCLPAGMDLFGLSGAVLAPPQEFLDAVLAKSRPTGR
jgi:hypothetical protein